MKYLITLFAFYYSITLGLAANGNVRTSIENGGQFYSGTWTGTGVPFISSSTVPTVASVQMANRQSFSNANVAISSTSSYVAQTGTLTAVRSATMPLANSVPPGTTLVIVDESKTASTTNYINCVVSGTNTFSVNDPTTPSPTALPISSPGMSLSFVSDGTNVWRQNDTVNFRRIIIPASTNGNPSTGIYFDTYANGTSLTWDTSQKKLRVNSSRVDLLFGFDFQPGGFLQVGNHQRDNAYVNVVTEGDATTLNTPTPSKRIGFETTTFTITGTSVTTLYSCIRGQNDGTNPYISVYASGTLPTPALVSGTVPWPPATAGTESTRFTIGGVDVLGLGLLNVGTGITFTGTGAAATRANGSMAISGSNNDITAMGAIAVSGTAGVGGIGNGTSKVRLATSAGQDSWRFDLSGTNVFSIGSSGGSLVSTTMGLTIGGNLIFSTSGAGIVGTTTNNDVSAGSVGQFVSSLVASGSAISFSNNTAANVTSISLTAGDWDVSGNINIDTNAATVTQSIGGISTTSATLPTDGSQVYSGVQFTLVSATNSISLPRKRISLSATTTVYLVGQVNFSAGSVIGFGSITARRVR